MSSDSEHISKPSKRVRCRISDSSDSSDDSVIIRINRKRRNNNVFSDESSSDDSDVQQPGLSRRYNKQSIKPELIDDSSDESGCSSEIVESETSTEWESDWISDHIEDSDDDTISKKPMKDVKRKMNKASVKPQQNSDTDESDGQTEKCPICLLSFRSQEIGTPSSCEHCFCLLCIIEWSKNVNTCPVDRQAFTSIDVRSHLGGKVVKQLPIEPPNKSEEHVQEDPTYCEICRLCDREDRMLLCDGCDSGFHLECLTPPMHQVPIEEWYCSECLPNNQQNLAESVEIDFDEIPDLMAEARGLGVTYGRTRTGYLNEVDIMGHFQHMYRQRLIPRTRQSERVRANIRADRNRAREELTTTVITRAIPTFDPEQPSTSSGIDSISENSRGRSPNISSNSSRAKHTANNKTKRSKATSRKKKSRKMNKKCDTILREVRIREYNTDGEEKEIVTYVKVKSQTARRKHKKRGVKRRKKRKSQSTRRNRYCRVGSAGRITSTKTVRNRLALALGLARRPRGSVSTISLAPPNLKSSMPNRSNLTNARFRAGISQVNLFGDNIMLDYLPLGSDDETNEDNNVDGGSMVAVQRRNPTICTNRRRLALKGISDPVNCHESQSVDDLLGSIISSQQFWHSSKKNITLKADGTLLLPTDNTKSIVDDKNHVPVNDNNIIVDPVSENTLGTSTINSADIIQAPMYSHSRAGGVGNHNADSGGSFRGNYHDRGNRGHGGQDYGMRDSYSGGGGRPNYGGPGPRDGFGHGDLRPPPDALDFSSNFDNRRRPPGPIMPHFRNRLHPNYRNDMNRQRRFNNMDRGGLFRPAHLVHGPSFPHPNSFQGPSNMNNVPPPLMPPLLPSPIVQPEVNLSTITPEVEPVRNSSVLNESCADESSTVQDSSQLERLEGEECDIYGDIETPNDKSTDNDLKCDASVKNNDENNSESVLALLPPPAPPSDLLDYDENSKSDKNNESDNEDLVIDDTPKDTANTETNENQTEDIYDPFAVADSDTNDSDARDAKPDAKENELKNADPIESTVADNSLPPPLAPPPTPPDFLSMVDNVNDNDDDDDEDEEEKGDDCPNFSIYSSETMDVARHTEQELSQQIGPLEPPPLPPDIPDDDDIIVADVQACDLSEIPEPIDPYVESLRKERQTLCKIPSKKISSDSRGKITFKIGNKFKLNNRLSSLYDELDDAVEISIAQEKQAENEKAAEKEKKPVTVSLDVECETKDSKIHDKDNESTKSDIDVNGLNVKIDNKTLHKTNTQEEKVKSVAAADISAIEPIFDENSHKGKNTDGLLTSNKSESSAPLASTSDKTEPISIASTSRDEACIKNVNIEQHDDADDDADDDNDDNNDDDDDDLIQHSPESITEPDFQLQKDTVQYTVPTKLDEKDGNNDQWDSDGAYTPCKDEMPVRDTINSSEKNIGASTFESGLEPITPPTKDRTTDDLDDRCKTPIEYAGLGTEAISETDEAINFEEELTLLNLRKEKEMEDGEIVDENKLGGKKQSEKLSDSDDASNRKKKKEKREKSKQIGEKNKENISSDNQVAWKKISKNTKERQYREKGKRMESRDKEKDLAEKSRDKNKYREKSKEKTRKKIKDTNDRKKEKRKELPRYDVRKIVAEKPTRPRKDEYGRDIRDLSRSLSRTRSPVRANKRSHSREPRLSRSLSPRMRSRSRSWSRRLARSWSRNRVSPANKRSVSRSRRKSPPRDRRSLSRRRSRSILNRRSRRRSMSNQRQRRRRSISRKRRTRSRSYSRSRSRSKVRSRSRSRTPSRSRDARIKDKSKKHKSRSRSRRRKRSRTKTPPPRKATSKSRIKKRVKRKVSSTTANVHSIAVRSRSRSRDRSYSRDKNRSKNWGKSNDKVAGDRESFSNRDEGRDQQPISGQASGWSAQWTPSWSRSRSRTPTGVNRQHNDHLLESRGWSPSSLIGIPTASSLGLPPSSPPSQSSAVMGSSNVTGIAGGNEPHDAVGLPKNLTVILRNKDAIKNKKRKEKRAKTRKKPHEPERRKTSNKRNRTPPPSKEVFASGDNILVSVCFNNENASGQLNSSTSHLNENIPLCTTSKRRNREPIQAESSKRPKKDKSKDKRSKSPKVNKRDKKRKSKAAEIAASKKPVAVIDLDQSPFREQTPSPRDVIVLSDDEQDDDHNNNHHNMNINNNGNNNNNVGGAGNSNNVNSNNNNDANNINQIDNMDDDDDDDDDEDENGGNGDIRILGISTLSEQQKRMTSAAVQQHIQLQLMHQQQAEQQQQSGKLQNQDDEKDLQQQDQQQIPHKLHLQQRCSISSDLEQFIAQGPKTPPEPQVKFSINKQPCNLRPASMMHPLFDGDEDEDEEIEADDDDHNDDDDNDDEDDNRGNVENDVDDDEGDKCLQGTVGESTRDSNNKLMAKDKSGDNDICDDGEGRDEEEEDDDNEDIDDVEGVENDLQRIDGQKQTLDNESMSKEDHKKLRNTEESDGGIKIGPNTPPEPPMSPFTSPDAYDPFDPTKSRSPSPSAMDGVMSNDQKHCESTGTSLTSMKDTTTTANNEKSDSDKPKIISMVTIKHAISPDKDGGLSGISDSTKAIDNSTSKDQINQCVATSTNANSFATINPVLATVAAAVQRSGIFSVNNPAGFNVQRSLAQANHIGAGMQLNKRTNDRTPQLTNLFMNSVKNLPISMRGNKSNTNRNSLLPQNGNDLTMETTNDTTVIDTSSPYSPGSSLSDGIFDPPSPGRTHHSPSRPPGPSGSNMSNVMKNNSGNNSGNVPKNTRSTNDKKDAFDALFGSPPLMKTGAGNKLRMKKAAVKSKKMSNSKIGVRMDENQLQILDDLPSSAVEMQVKDKFLKKLNRQERVVEEVKLVLKPHYTKKHVTKEEYKDIMRKAVPKICHNRTGEINPKKIAQLIEAYVKRCRNNKRKGASTGLMTSNSAKPLRPPKNPWS